MHHSKPLITLRNFLNSSMPLTDRNNSVSRCLKHILFIKVKLQYAHSADKNTSVIISHSFSDFCFGKKYNLKNYCQLLPTRNGHASFVWVALYIVSCLRKCTNT